VVISRLDVLISTVTYKLLAICIGRPISSPSRCQRIDGASRSELCDLLGVNRYYTASASRLWRFFYGVHPFDIAFVSKRTVCEMRLLLKVNGHKLLIESRGKSFLIFSCAHPLLYGVEMMKSSSQLVLRLWSCLYSTGLLALVQASSTPS
jgi:hypothetical protein